MEIIRDKIFPQERALYASDGVKLVDCRFEGEEDGESALKESKNIVLSGCYMDLRYPLWHDTGVRLENCEMTNKCRAPLWYSRGIFVRDSVLNGVKALRECADAEFCGCEIDSPEFGWRTHGVKMSNCRVKGEYMLFSASGVCWNNVEFSGKYSFQYIENAIVENCTLDTKDAFWHTKNVTVKDSVINGEYLAWYSENLTLVNCKISGTQPLCYCKGLKLINCTAKNCDLSFEYSEVEADISGGIDSVKNPRSGRIAANGFGEIILTKDSVYPCECKITCK